jgi:hypothetical protein
MITDHFGNLWAVARNCIFIFDKKQQLLKTIESPFKEADAEKQRLKFVKNIFPLSNGDVLLYMYNGWRIYSANKKELLPITDPAYKNRFSFLNQLSNTPATVKKTDPFPEHFLFNVFDKYLLCMKPGVDSLMLYDEQGALLNSAYFLTTNIPTYSGRNSFQRSIQVNCF